MSFNVLISHVYFHIYFFVFNVTTTTVIYTLSLHDALPIWSWTVDEAACWFFRFVWSDLSRLQGCSLRIQDKSDRKSTRLNSSHQIISYAVFCLKKKKKI